MVFDDPDLGIVLIVFGKCSTSFKESVILLTNIQKDYKLITQQKKKEKKYF